MIYLFFLVLLGLDQASKFWAREVLQTKGSISILGEFFRLTYVENRGAAFGLLQGQSVLFVIATFIAIISLSYIYYLQKKKKYSASCVSQIYPCDDLCWCGGQSHRSTDAWFCDRYD